MAMMVRSLGPADKPCFVQGTVCYSPQELREHFKKFNTLTISEGDYLYVWLNKPSNQPVAQLSNEPSIEWGKNHSKVLKETFNRILTPIDKSIQKISTSGERMQLETFNDGFRLFALHHPLQVHVK